MVKGFHSKILINCDMGESDVLPMDQEDKDVFPFIHMASVACGGHASNPTLLLETIRLAKQYQVKVGAHPSYPDRENFGRKSVSLSADTLYAEILFQISSVLGICQSESISMEYIKPHGALYHDMQKDLSIFEVILNTLCALDSRIFLVVPAFTLSHEHQHAAKERGIHLIYEAFADRRYTETGHLKSRQHADAVLNTPEDIIHQARQIAQYGTVISDQGHEIQLAADTLCFHGDNPASVSALKQLKKDLV
ncbi:5-oxoprolinase subunit PxpA [Algicola sagamiensis]|uniref:5-oxoprolinase subunit PxpA n=1 Tax=Algicola sagamiensis TaxID=163869 RepID=UPI00036EC481|nr:5-oxoprolinase subunit PxpA [Algicola sagamiensis]